MPNEKPVQDTFTRLNIAMCEHDVGIRELECSCSGCKCIAMNILPGLSLAAGEEATINTTISNYGNMDATAVLMESSYTIFIGNERESFVPIGTQTIPIIPAGRQEVAVTKWTPPDTQSTHACIHTRVFDTYSTLNANKLKQESGIDIFSWRSRENPQAGWKNVRLIPITNANQPLVITYIAKNFSKTSNVATNTLITKVNSRTRILNIDEEYPLPFRLNLKSNGRINNTFLSSAIKGMSLRKSTGLRVPTISFNNLWPRTDVNPDFVHTRFGITEPSSLSFPRRLIKQKLGHFFSKQDPKTMKVSSLYKRLITPQEEIRIPIVIPPSEFPKRGSRKVFRIDYQKGSEEPIVHHIYLYH